MEFRHWYVIFVMTGQEDDIKRDIESRIEHRTDLSVALLVPKRELYERKSGVVKAYKKIMFPGYILVGTEQIQELYNNIHRCKGILKFLRDDEGFQQISLDEISRIVYMTDDGGVIGTSEICLSEAQKIQILSGPLKGHEGSIKKINLRKGRVQVEFGLSNVIHQIWLSVKIVKELENT